MQTTFGPWLKKWNLIDVTGPAIQCLTSVTHDSNRIVVTLCNNFSNAWNGSVSLKGGKIASCKDLITGQLFGSGNSVSVKAGGNDLVILDVTSVSPWYGPRTRLPHLLPPLMSWCSKVTRRLRNGTNLRPRESWPCAAVGTRSRPAPSPGALYVNAWLFDGMDPDHGFRRLTIWDLTALRFAQPSFTRLTWRRSGAN